MLFGFFQRDQIVPLAPLTESAMDEKAQQTFGRLGELFGDEPIPVPFSVYANVPAFLQDFYMNFKKFVLNDEQILEAVQCAATIAAGARFLTSAG